MKIHTATANLAPAKAIDKVAEPLNKKQLEQIIYTVEDV